MRIVVVEDSRLARAELRTLLAAAPDVEIVGEADDVAAGVEAVDTLRPDLLLLDIQLPGGTGFDLLDRIDHLPLVVFTTAYDQHALDAFERNAIDYLVKPIVPERLAAALGRTRERLASLRASANANAAATPGAPRKGADEMVFVRDGERCWFVRLGDISGFEACGNYAQAWFDGKRPLVGRTLAQLEERLDDALFFRASRSHLVNLRWIDQVVPWINDGYRVTLRDGHTVEVSRRQAKVLRERLEL
jgi:two-component system LytT family response regulator